MNENEKKKILETVQKVSSFEDVQIETDQHGWPKVKVGSFTLEYRGGTKLIIRTITMNTEPMRTYETALVGMREENFELPKFLWYDAAVILLTGFLHEIPRIFSRKDEEYDGTITSIHELGNGTHMVVKGTTAAGEPFHETETVNTWKYFTRRLQELEEIFEDEIFSNTFSNEEPELYEYITGEVRTTILSRYIPWYIFYEARNNRTNTLIKLFLDTDTGKSTMNRFTTESPAMLYHFTLADLTRQFLLYH